MQTRGKNSLPQGMSKDSHEAGEATELKRVKTPDSAHSSKSEIDPLRVLVWAAFVAILIAAWVAIVWTVTALV